MRKMLGVLVLGALCFTLLAASPAAAQWPAGRSFLMIDLGGFDIECVDITASGKTAFFFWSGKGGAVTLAYDHTGIGHSNWTATVKNDVVWGGLYGPLKEAQVDCSCSRRGSSRWYLIAAPAFNGSCACEATYTRFPGGGTLNETLNVLEIGGHDCAWFYGARPETKGPLFKSRIGTVSR